MDMDVPLVEDSSFNFYHLRLRYRPPELTDHVPLIPFFPIASPTAVRYAMDMDLPLFEDFLANFYRLCLRILQRDCNDAQKLRDPFPVKTFQEDKFRFRQRCSHAVVAHTAEHSMEAKATTTTRMEAALGYNFYTGERSNGAWKTTDARFANGGDTRDRQWVVQNFPKWLLDSGASYHLRGDRTIIRSLHSREPKYVKTASGAICKLEECGRVEGAINLFSVMHFPGLSENLVSAGLLANGGDTRFLQRDCNDAKKLGDPFPVKTFQEDKFRFRSVSQNLPHVMTRMVGRSIILSLMVGTILSLISGSIMPLMAGSLMLLMAGLFMMDILLMVGLYLIIILLELGSSLRFLLMARFYNRFHRAAEDNSNQAPMNALLQTGWHVASAVANHLTGNLYILTDYISFPGGRAVNVPYQGRMKALGSGSVKTHNVVLQNVWYVPGLEMNLVSAGQLTKLGHKVCFGPYGCRISKGSDDNVIGKARFTDDFQFEVEFVKVPPPN